VAAWVGFEHRVRRGCDLQAPCAVTLTSRRLARTGVVCFFSSFTKFKNKNMENWNQEIENLHIGFRLVGLNFHPKHLELVFEIQKAIQEKGDALTLKEISKIEREIEAKHKPIVNEP
jgi:hypothetical protein